MPDECSDRERLLQEDWRALLKLAVDRFSPAGRAAEREKSAAKTRAWHAAHRAAKRLPAKIANKRARQRRYKHRLAIERKADREAMAAEVAALLIDLPPEPLILDEQVIAIERAALIAFVGTRGARQGQLRKVDPDEIMACRRVQMKARGDGSATSWGRFADLFGTATGRAWSREQAKRRVALLTALEGSGGPWQASPEGVRGFYDLPEVCVAGGKDNDFV